MSKMGVEKIMPGDKIELWMTEQNAGRERRFLTSMVQGIRSEDTLEIAMPMENSKMVLLQEGKEYTMMVYSANGLYQCRMEGIDRYKENNIFLAVVRLLTPLKKQQRREYYRLDCSIDMQIRNLLKEEIETVAAGMVCKPEGYLPMDRALIVDLSGGGLRFIADTQYERDSLVYIRYDLQEIEEVRRAALIAKNKEESKLDAVLPKVVKTKRYDVVCRLLSVREVPDRPGKWEGRAQYLDMDDKTREELIQQIFIEERKQRRKESNL